MGERRRFFSRVSSDDVFDHVLLDKALFKDYKHGQESVAETPQDCETLPNRCETKKDKESVDSVYQETKKLCWDNTKKPVRRLDYLKSDTQGNICNNYEKYLSERYLPKKYISNDLKICDFVREPPSYWVGFIYRFVPGTTNLEIIVQQTGVLPDRLYKYRYSKLKVSVALVGRRSKKVTLIDSRDDYSFRSHRLNLPAKDKYAVRETGMRARLYHYTNMFSKTCFVEWQIELTRCTTEAKTEWRRFRNSRE